jgi:hypothetical protein
MAVGLPRKLQAQCGVATAYKSALAPSQACLAIGLSKQADVQNRENN